MLISRAAFKEAERNQRRTSLDLTAARRWGVDLVEDQQFPKPFSRGCSWGRRLKGRSGRDRCRLRIWEPKVPVNFRPCQITGFFSNIMRGLGKDEAHLHAAETASKDLDLESDRYRQPPPRPRT